MGTPTFGKGTVQNAISLENGGALWLTTAKYYTPSGVCIEGEGIKPNLEIKPFIPTPEEKEVIEKLKKSQVIEKFLELSPEWEEKKLSPLIKELEEKEGIKVKENILMRVLREKDKNKENDILNDRQLIQAINLLKSLPAIQGKIFKKVTITQ